MKESKRLRDIKTELNFLGDKIDEGMAGERIVIRLWAILDSLVDYLIERDKKFKEEIRLELRRKLEREEQRKWQEEIDNIPTRDGYDCYD